MLKRIERKLRHGVIDSLVRALDRGSDGAESVDLDRVRRVLFVRPNFRLGNLVLTTPALSIARRSLPEAELHLLTTSPYRKLLRGHPDVDRLVTLDREMFYRPWSLIRFVRAMRAVHYDLAVDCSEGESMTGAFLARLSAARWRVAPRGSPYAPLYNVRVPLDRARHHRVERLADLLEEIGFSRDDLGLSVELSASERGWAERRAREWNFPGDTPIVGVNIGARNDKRWPIERFLDVIRGFDAERDVGIVVFAGPEDRDRLAALEGRLPESVAVDTTDRVRRFAALLERCAVFVTGDTGPMHLAAAVGTPTVSIFLKDNHATFAPIGTRHRCVLEEGGDIEPDAVVRTAFDALDSVSHSPESASTG